MSSRAHSVRSNIFVNKPNETKLKGSDVSSSLAISAAADENKSIARVGQRQPSAVTNSEAERCQFRLPELVSLRDLETKNQEKPDSEPRTASIGFAENRRPCTRFLPVLSVLLRPSR